MTIAGIFGAQEIIITIILILVITGGSFIPRMMKNMGKGVRNMEEKIKDPDEKIKDTINDILRKQEKAK